MLLKFDLCPVRVADKELQYPVGAAPLYGDVGNPSCAELFGHGFYVVRLKTEMTEQSFLAAGIWFLKDFKKAAAARVQKKSIAFAGGIAELMGDLKSENPNIKTLGCRQVA